MKQIERGKTGPKSELQDVAVPQLTRTQAATDAENIQDGAVPKVGRTQAATDAENSPEAH